MRTRAATVLWVAACVALAAGSAAARTKAKPPPESPPPPAETIVPEQQSGMERSKIGEQKAVVMVYFALGTSQLDATAEATLEQALPRLAGSDPITIGGHTDAVGEAKYNQNLSEMRAKAVRQYLIAHGIDAERLTAVGYGKAQPVDTNETEEGRAHNRRAVLKVGAPPG